MRLRRAAKSARPGATLRLRPQTAPAARPAWLHEQGDNILVDILVAPRASRSRIMGVHDNRLKVQLAAVPVEGQANDALVRFLAQTLDVARAQVEVVGGVASKRKTVRLAGMRIERVLLRLSPACG